jgi:hypothetical protein
VSAELAAGQGEDVLGQLRGLSWQLMGEGGFERGGEAEGFCLLRRKVARHSWCCHPPAVSGKHDAKFSPLRTIQVAVKPRGSRVWSGFFFLGWLCTVLGWHMAYGTVGWFLLWCKDGTREIL